MAELGEPVEETAVRDWFLNHATWLATIAWLSLITVKANRVAHGNIATSLVILSSANVLSIAFYVLSSAIPLLLQIVVFQATTRVFEPKITKSTRLAAGIATFGAGAIGLFMMPRWLFILTLVLTCVTGSLAIRSRRRKAKGKSTSKEIASLRRLDDRLAGARSKLEAMRTAGADPQTLAAQELLVGNLEESLGDGLTLAESRVADQLRVAVIALVATPALAVLLGTILVDSMWLPAERLVVVSRSPIVGYALSADDQWLLILEESDRKVLRIRTTDLKNREYCTNSSGSATQTMWDTFTQSRPPEYRSCAGGAGKN